MELLALATDENGVDFLIPARGYEFGEEGLVVHRNVTDGLLWRISDVASGSHIGFISPSKKQAIKDFYDGEYLEKIIRFKKTTKYENLVKRFEKAKEEYLKTKVSEVNAQEMDISNSSENSR